MMDKAYVTSLSNCPWKLKQIDDITFHYLSLMRHGIYNGNRNASKTEELWNIPLRQDDKLSIDLNSEKKMQE